MSRGGVSHGEHRLATVGGCLELDVPPTSGRGGKPAQCASPEYSRAEMASWAVFSKHPKGRLHCRVKAWEARPEPLLTPRKRPQRRKSVTPSQLSPGGIPFSGPAGQSRIAARVFPLLSLWMELQALQALVPGLTTPTPNPILPFFPPDPGL